MRSLVLIALIAGACTTLTAQVNTNSISVPNTGANTTPPPLTTYTSPADNLSNPSNSTVPGANGSYSVDPGKPSLTSPNTGPFTTPSSSPAPTYTPQRGTSTPTKSTNSGSK